MYDIGFLKWSRHTFMLYPSERELGNGFFRGLELPLCLVSKNLIAVIYFFSHIINYMRAIKRACNKTYKGRGKRTCHRYRAIGILSGSLFMVW